MFEKDHENFADADELLSNAARAMRAEAITPDALFRAEAKIMSRLPIRRHIPRRALYLARTLPSAFSLSILRAKSYGKGRSLKSLVLAKLKAPPDRPSMTGQPWVGPVWHSSERGNRAEHGVSPWSTICFAACDV